MLFNVNNKTTLNPQPTPVQASLLPLLRCSLASRQLPNHQHPKGVMACRAVCWGHQTQPYDNSTRCERHRYPRFTDKKTEAQSQVSNLPEITRLTDVETRTQVGSDSNTSTGQPTGLFIPTPVCPHLFCSPTSTAKAEKIVVRDNKRRLTPTSATSSHSVCLAETCLSRTPSEFGLVSKARRLHSNVTFWNPHSMCGSLCHSKSCPIIFWY